jgi:hypothetical protein
MDTKENKHLTYVLEELIYMLKKKEDLIPYIAFESLHLYREYLVNCVRPKSQGTEEKGSTEGWREETFWKEEVWSQQSRTQAVKDLNIIPETLKLVQERAGNALK